MHGDGVVGPVSLAEVAATARRLADAMSSAVDGEAGGPGDRGDRPAMAAALIEAADSVDRLDGPEALLELRSALVMSRSAWAALDPVLTAEAARVLAGAKRLAIEL